MKFNIGQKVSFDIAGNTHSGVIIGYNNGIYQIQCYGFNFGMKEEDLKGE